MLFSYFLLTFFQVAFPIHLVGFNYSDFSFDVIFLDNF